MQFPYGLADFATLRRDGFIYIDRTDRIERIETMGHQLLLLRPRRFGKSLWLSTLENYYDLAKAEQFDQLFADLGIGKKPTPKRNSYLVMKWNFSLVEPLHGRDAIRASLHRHLNAQIKNTALKYAAWLKREVAIDANDALASFQDLLGAITESGQRLYLLIDEYDNFANEVLVSRDQGEERYNELVSGEGAIKSLFKVIKDGAEGRGLERVFMTGVTPVVMADITSGYNVIQDISLEMDFDDLCGFHEEEIAGILEQISTVCGQSIAKAEEAFALMRTFYNGYNFCLSEEKGLVFNPTLALYFFQHFQRNCIYPDEMLDSNLAMDRNRIEYVAKLPHGQQLVEMASEPDAPIIVSRLENRFGVDEMLRNEQEQEFLASLLYYFGVLTYAGRNLLGKVQLVAPNLVVRKLYIERMRQAYYSGYALSQERNQVCERFYAHAELEPLVDFIERHYLTAYDNRDLRWSNELTLKTAFLTTLYNDALYILDSETAIGRGYADLSLIVRPDRRQYSLLDHVLEFKTLSLKEVGLTGEALQQASLDELRALSPVQQKLAEAEIQLVRYREALKQTYDDKLKLHTHAVVGIGLLRLVW